MFFLVWYFPDFSQTVVYTGEVLMACHISQDIQNANLIFVKTNSTYPVNTNGKSQVSSQQKEYISSMEMANETACFKGYRTS